MGTSTSTARLYWIPLGAGQRVVQLTGRVFEAVSAAAARRDRCDLFHAALVISTPDREYSIEVAPVPDANGVDRGVVGEGPVGVRWLGRFRLFRYEVRCWPDGVIPDLAAAVQSTVVELDEHAVERLPELLPGVPTPVWGRDELAAGEMWNSNSVVAWLLACGGADLDSIELPPSGRAPGWDAGRVVAARVDAVATR